MKRKPKVSKPFVPSKKNKVHKSKKTYTRKKKVAASLESTDHFNQRYMEFSLEGCFDPRFS